VTRRAQHHCKQLVTRLDTWLFIASVRPPALNSWPSPESNSGYGPARHNRPFADAVYLAASSGCQHS